MSILYNQSILKNFFYLYAALFILFLFNFFTDIAALGTIVSFTAFAVLFISWLFASRLFRMIGAAFVSVGVILSLTAGESLMTVVTNTTSNLPLLFFFSILPWIGTVVKVGGLDESITDMVQDEQNRVEKIYGRSLFTTYFLGVFLNLSAIYIIQQVISDLFKKASVSLRHEFIIKSTLRAFSLAVIWSPLEVVVGLTVDSTGLSYFTLLPWLILCSLVTCLSEIYISRKEFRNVTLDAPFKNVNKKELRHSILKMIVLLASFMSLVMTLNIFSSLGFVMTVALIIIPFSFITALIMQKFELFLKGGWTAWRNHNNTLQNFAVLFLSLGIFSEGFNVSPLPGLMQQVFGYIDSFVVLILILIMLVIYALAMFGVHPIATLAILFEVLNPIINADNVLSIAIVMIVCGLSIAPAAPYGLNATMTSQYLGINPYRITKTNIGFAFRMGFITIAIAMIPMLF
ncbi:hypothetical protein [Salinicoccus carnicancri]|uniref:hypothetical protein n=1 Tax=Salinicoccus carnicancri TaxID=558170 RepID=UPI00030757D0|nr:hypothetical protein [Salinicoccus carnicancri]